MQPRASLVLLALGLAAAVHAKPLQKPTARPGFCLNKMMSEIATTDNKPKGYGIIFYGDSIFETLRGTDKCRNCSGNPTRRSSCAGVPAIFQSIFGGYHPGVMAMSMDETAHLLWRLQHGAIPKKNKPKAAVLLIGTNDLTNSGWSITEQSLKEKMLAEEEPGIVSRITQAADLLRSGMPDTKVLMLGILPRGTGTGKGVLNAYNDFSWPSHYTTAITSINGKLKVYATRSKGKVSFLDCGKVFVSHNLIDATLMADAIHPTAAGWAKLAACMLPRIKQLMV